MKNPHSFRRFGLFHRKTLRKIKAKMNSDLFQTSGHIFLAIFIVLFQNYSTVFSQGIISAEELENQVSAIRNVAAGARARYTECVSLLREAPPGSACYEKYFCDESTVTYEHRELMALAERLDARANEIESHIPEVRRLHRKFDNDRVALSRLGIEKTLQDILTWEKLYTDDRLDLKRETKKILLDTAFAGAGIANNIVLNRWQTKRIITELKRTEIGELLKKKGVSVKSLIDHFVKLHDVRNKKLRVQLVGLALNKLEKIKDVALSGTNEGVQVLELLKMTLGWLNGNPLLQLLITEVEVVTRLVYSATLGRIVKARIGQLTKLTEAKLIALKKLQALLEKDIRELGYEFELIPHYCIHKGLRIS